MKQCLSVVQPCLCVVRYALSVPCVVLQRGWEIIYLPELKFSSGGGWGSGGWTVVCIVTLPTGIPQKVFCGSECGTIAGLSIVHSILIVFFCAFKLSSLLGFGEEQSDVPFTSPFFDKAFDFDSMASLESLSGSSISYFMPLE
ncbi:hypothetical protein CEXT_50271 [Caerostris extrusa]|uniref:Uncharacterized protein n=1 Tax=Caerostris extrusa TaxID=172846 RepID=A0AAV4ND94_CAEEX|nr:hypothetical protein CEXT_50271 [Caerostris extrusa]